MTKKKKEKKGKNKGDSLSGVAQVAKHPIVTTITEGGLLLLTAIAAGGAGAVLGKHSLVAGVPVTLVGIHKQNKYLIAAGLGLTLSNGFQGKKEQSTTTQGVDGFDIKQIAAQAKDRVGTFFKNFSQKLYLSPKSETVAGLGEANEQVSYFINPYNNASEIDMSAIDRVQEQIAEMAKEGTAGLSETDREF